MAQVKTKTPGGSSSSTCSDEPVETPPMRQPYYTPSPLPLRSLSATPTVKQEPEPEVVDVRGIFMKRKLELDLLLEKQVNLLSSIRVFA
jgi:hypothetical protein